MVYEFMLLARRWDDDYERNHTYEEFATAKDVKHIAEKYVVADKYVYIEQSNVWLSEQLKQSVETVKRDTNGEPIFNTDGTPMMTKFWFTANVETLPSFKSFVKDADSYTIERGSDNRYSPAREYVRVNKKVRFEVFVIRFENMDEFVEFMTWQGIAGLHGYYHYGSSLVKDSDDKSVMYMVLEF